MTESEDLRLFFNQLTQLCLKYSRGQFPPEVREALDRWSDASLEATRQSNFFELLESGLATLRDQSPLGRVMQQELSGVLALQSAAMNIPGWPFDNDEIDVPTRKRLPIFRLPAKAIRASKSLLGSLREILKGLVPDWVLGILKVFEEIAEIYGPPS